MKHTDPTNSSQEDHSLSVGQDSLLDFYSSVSEQPADKLSSLNVSSQHSIESHHSVYSPHEEQSVQLPDVTIVGTQPNRSFFNTRRCSEESEPLLHGSGGHSFLTGSGAFQQTSPSNVCFTQPKSNGNSGSGYRYSSHSSQSAAEEIEPLLSRSNSCSGPDAKTDKQRRHSERTMETDFCELNNNFPEDERFQRMIREAEKSIEEGNLPLRISQGSSGSYFVRDRQDVMNFLNLLITILLRRF